MSDPRIIPAPRLRGVLSTVLALAACSPGDGRSPADRMAARHGVADLVFFNGTVLTMDPRMPRAQAIAVREGRIIALGDDADIEPLTNAATRLENLEGRTLIPGLLDARDPDAGRVAPVCTEALPGTVPAEPQRLDVTAEVRSLMAAGVVAVRLPTVSVDALPALIAQNREHPATMHVRIAHWPACGPEQRARLQQIMRDLAEDTRSDTSTLRVALDPTPAEVQPAPPPLALTDAAPVATAPVPPAVAPPGLPAVDTKPLPWQAMAESRAAAGEAGAAEAQLRGFTADAARAMGLERESGVLAPGRRADLAVLDRNPLRESADRVASTVVVQTWFGGALVYQKDAGSAP